MKGLINIEAELKKRVAYIKKLVYLFFAYAKEFFELSSLTYDLLTI